MTVRDWIVTRTPRAPEALQVNLLAALADEADAEASRTPAVCLAAAARALHAILAGNRFDRHGALDLLTVDALATYAYEYAAASNAVHLDAFAEQGAALFGRLLTHHV